MPPTTPANNTSPGNVPTPSPLPSELLLTTGSSLPGSFSPDLRLQTQQQNSAAPQPGLPGDSLRDQARSALNALKGGRPAGHPEGSRRLVSWGASAALVTGLIGVTFWGVKSGEHKPIPVEVKPGKTVAANKKNDTGAVGTDKTPKTSATEKSDGMVKHIEAPPIVDKRAIRGSPLGGDLTKTSKKNEVLGTSAEKPPSKDLAPGASKSSEAKPPNATSGAKETAPSTEKSAPAGANNEPLSSIKPETTTPPQDSKTAEQKKAEIEKERDRPALTLVHHNVTFIADYLKQVTPRGLQPKVFDPTDENFTPESMRESIDQCIQALAEMSPMIAGKVTLDDPLQRLKREWPEDKQYAARSFDQRIAYVLGTDSSKQPPLNWTPKKKPVVTDPSPSAPEPPKVVGTVSPEITEAGKRMNYFLFQINRSISQARLTPPKLKLDSAESILQTLTDINFCLTQMQLSDVKQVAVDGYNFGKIIQEVGSAWSMGVDKGLAAVEKLFPRVEE